MQIWRLITNFFFLGPFSFPFAFRLIIIAKYGVSLERGPFDQRTADFVWMFFFGALSLLVSDAVPALWSPFMGVSLVFMIVYIWGREFPNARISIYGLVSLKGFYLPWAMLALDLIFGNPLKPDILGIVAGHIYYFLTVLHPLAGGKYVFKTPRFVYILFLFGIMFAYNCSVNQGGWILNPLFFPPVGVGTNWWRSGAKSDPSAGVAFRGRSYRLSGGGGRRQTPPASGGSPAATTGEQQQGNAAEGVAFRGRSYRLDSDTHTNAST
ncbi:unnamed protein product [Linum tenue]|uniref:Derlin n=1 Tax=Linum tenue TaxID=586396 RepID=A0AAV0MU38_9ROSI|nr:unnamed protein product [Linum tenue]